MHESGGADGGGGGSDWQGQAGRQGVQKFLWKEQGGNEWIVAMWEREKGRETDGVVRKEERWNGWVLEG